jgi:hypothetical protein
MAAAPAFHPGRLDPLKAGVLKAAWSLKAYSLKKVVAIGTVQLTAAHAAVLEICARRRRGMDRCGRAFRAAPCRPELPANRA